MATLVLASNYYRNNPFPKPFGSVISKGRVIPVYKVTQSTNFKRRTTYMAGVNLSKGESVNLTKAIAGGLAVAMLGAGWDPAVEGKTMDLDLALFSVNAQNRTINEDGFIFFNHKETANKSIVHAGDNLTGEGDGDDEQITIDFTKLDPAITKLVAVVGIYNAAKKGQNLSDLKNAFVRCVDQATGEELAKYEINTAMNGDNLLFAEFTKDSNNEWHFHAVGQAGTGEFKYFVDKYGMQAAA